MVCFGTGLEPGLFQLMQYNDSSPLTIVGAGVAMYDSPIIYATYDSKCLPTLEIITTMFVYIIF